MRRIAQRLREHDWLAAGIELVIVVVGILIALQVSNWNQDRQDARRGREYLQRIDSDLESDIEKNAQRARFMAQVDRYGRQALADAEDGVLVDGSGWKTVLAYFQASQFYPYSHEDSAFIEMRDAGDLGLIHDTELRGRLAFFYASRAQAYAETMLFNHIPPYRQDVRELTPVEVQDYIWTHCSSTPSVGDQRIGDCPPAIDEARARSILAGYSRHPELARELRYWLSIQSVVRQLNPNQVQEARTLQDEIRAYLRR
jgi:hypothetical protein